MRELRMVNGEVVDAQDADPERLAAEWGIPAAEAERLIEGAG